MIYRFGTFEFDAADGSLRREGRMVPLEPKPARALALLLERAGELVTRDEMRKHLWDAGTHVDFDRSLAYCIGQVRQALSDIAENPRFVQTVPRRGFKFITSVAVQGQAAIDSRELAPEPVVSPGARRRSHVPLGLALVVVAIAVITWTVVQGRSSSPPIVAVALFDNETGEAVHDRGLSRMTDAVVERLTALGPKRVGVVGNYAVLRQPRAVRNLDAIARDTAAGYIVLVQLQTRALDLSLLLQLIRVSDGVHVWVRRMALTADEVDRVDEQVAGRIEAAVRQHVLGEQVNAP